ncbi:hypothetical protein N7490_002835 [Penicillium lividum]|nr:hypothetical protein N7490_002835 [Penicillium lividum]
MHVGGCFCGNVRVELNGDPINWGLCHCLDCRKLTGGAYSYSLIVKTTELAISGDPKEVPKTADSGNFVKNYFCPDCGTPLFGHRINADGSRAEITVVRAGIFDDIRLLDQSKPGVELYSESRLKWLCAVEGAIQVSGMMPLQ